MLTFCLRLKLKKAHCLRYLVNTLMSWIRQDRSRVKYIAHVCCILSVCVPRCYSIIKYLEVFVPVYSLEAYGN